MLVLPLLALGVTLPLLSAAAAAPEAAGQEYIQRGQGGYSQYMSDWSSDSWLSGGRLNQPKCVDIPSNMTLCQNIDYKQMRLPNLLEHDTLQEATQQAGPWVSLINRECHHNTQLFLCSLFSPVCLDRPIWPCRTLCEAVKAGCEDSMKRYGYPWPEMLRCDKFPPDNDLCISLSAQKKDETKCAACNHPETFEALVDNFCESDFALRIRLDEHVVVGGDLKVTALKKKKKFKESGVTKKELRQLVLWVSGGAACECPQVSAAGKRDSLIVMGKKTAGRLVVSHLVKYDKNCKETKRAVKAIQKNAEICKGVPFIPPSSSSSSSASGGRDKGGRRRGGGGGGDKRDEAKGRRNRNNNGGDNANRKNRKRNRNGDGNDRVRRKNRRDNGMSRRNRGGSSAN